MVVFRVLAVLLLIWFLYTVIGSLFWPFWFN